MPLLVHALYLPTPNPVGALFACCLPRTCTHALLTSSLLTACRVRPAGRGSQKATPLLTGAAGVQLHECEVGDFIGGARTGSKARNCELLIGDTYQYAHSDGGAAHELRVIYQAPQWGALRQALQGKSRSLRTLQYALSCTGQAYGTTLSGPIFTILTVLSWICVGMHMCGALPSPVLA